MVGTEELQPRLHIYSPQALQCKVTKWIPKSPHCELIISATYIMRINIEQRKYWHGQIQIRRMHSWKEHWRQRKHFTARGQSPFSNLHQLHPSWGAVDQIYYCLWQLSLNHSGQVGDPKAGWGGPPVAQPLFSSFFSSFLSFSYVRWLLNSWSSAEFFSAGPCNGLLYYGGPCFFVKVYLMTRLYSPWQSWQIDVKYQIVSDQVSDNWRKKNELTRHNFFLVVITNRWIYLLWWLVPLFSSRFHS